MKRFLNMTIATPEGVIFEGEVESAEFSRYVGCIYSSAVTRSSDFFPDRGTNRLCERWETGKSRYQGWFC